MLDFESANAASNPMSEELLNYYSNYNNNQEEDLIYSFDEEFFQDDTVSVNFEEYSRPKLKSSSSGKSITPDYKFYWNSIFYIPIGLLEGSMGAIPSNTNNYYCSSNSTAIRGYTTSMTSDFSAKENDDGMN